MKMQKIHHLLLFSAAGVLSMMLSQAVFAEVITAERVFTTQAAGNKIYSDDRHINASDGVVNNWRSTAPNGSGGDYYNGYPAPSFIIDLGMDCTLDSFDFTGIGNKNTVSNITLNYATSSQGMRGFSDSPFTTSLNNTTAKQNIVLDSSVTARYVQVTLNDNFFDGNGGGGDRVGMADIQFNGTKTSTTHAAITPTTNATYDFLVQPIDTTELNGDGKTTITDGDRLRNLHDGTLDTPTNQNWYTRQVGQDDNANMAGGTRINDFFQNGVSPILCFDLGDEYLLNGMTLWGYDIQGNLLKEFGLNFYDSDGDLLDSGFNFLLENTITGTQSVDFSFDQLNDVQYVEMILLDNFYNGTLAGGDRVGFTGVRFHGLEAQSSATPEPATWVMMVLGLLGGAVVCRRRRK